MSEDKHPGGRPTDYKEGYAEQAYKLCLLGAIDKDLASFFDVCEKTINNWKEENKEFLQSLKAGKGIADAEVVKSLHQRALGYSHKDVHVSNYQGEITLTELMKHYPPDTTAGIFWLKNRRSGEWRDKQDVEQSGELTIKIQRFTEGAEGEDDD